MLAEGQEDIRHRLIDAYVDQVHHARTDKQLPPAMANRVEALHQRMTNVAQKAEEGSIAATVAARTDSEVASAVREIVRIALELQTL